ncbi:MAG: GNAT family N-acetyltransferase [Oscillospiraceae bacterium]|nr:GNAT family N-acetyltransferase [Oscillospiraceae bacterium]
MLVDINNHIIRKFSVEDKNLVVEFFGQMGGESRGFFNRGSGNENDALSYFDKSGDEPDRVRFLSSVRNEDGREIMTGYIFAWDMDLCVPTLGIAVREEYKGHGLGRLLIQHLTNYLHEYKYGGVMLTTSFANIRGQSLYTRMGFRHIGTHTSGEMLYILNFGKYI